MATRMTGEEAERIVRQFKVLITVLVVVFLLPLVIYAVYLDHRLDEFKTSLEHSSPEELEPEDSEGDDPTKIPVDPVRGQVVYVPAYSHVYATDGDPHLLTITLSVRNTSSTDDIVVKSIRYFDTKGREVKRYLDNPVRLPALGTTEVIIERDDTTGGSGANFLIEWFASAPVSAPIIEAVMIGTDSRQGISFVTRGAVVSEAMPESESDNATDEARDESNTP